MANEPARPQFQLNGTQMLALFAIEAAQNALNHAAASCASAQCGEKDAAELLATCLRELEAAKVRWLHETQRAIRVVNALPSIPSKLNGVVVMP